MPGTCTYSNESNRNIAQRLANSVQVNNRALFDNINRNQSWLNNSLATVMKLRTYKSGEGVKIMDEFEKVAGQIQSANHTKQLKEYIKYQSIDDMTWKVLEEYRRKLPSGRVRAPGVYKKVIELFGEEAKDLVSEAQVMQLYSDNIHRGRTSDILAQLPAEVIPAINRFIAFAKDTDILPSFELFFSKASNPSLFLQKYLSNESYAGMLREIYKTANIGDIRSNTEKIIEDFVTKQLTSLYPDETKTAIKKMTDVVLLKNMEKHLINGKLGVFLRSMLAETRILSTISKFTLGGPGAVLMLGQNLFVNVLQHRGLKKGVPAEFYRHPLIDELINSNILDGTDFFENHKVLMNGASAETWTEKLYRASFEKPITWFMDKMPLKPGARETLDNAMDITKDVALTGIHNLQDHIMAGPHLRAGIASAAFEIFGDQFDWALKSIRDKTMPEDLLNRFIVRAQELGESGNNAFSFGMLRQHMLSNGAWSAVSYLQGYHMQRIGEFTASMKKFADAWHAGEINNIEDFKQHLWTTNPELRKALFITFDAVHMGFYVDQFYDDENNNSTLDYSKLFHEYVSSLSANVLTRMMTNIVSAHSNLEIYKDATGKDIPMLQGVGTMFWDFIDSIPGQMFREFDVAKIVPRMMEAWQADDGALATALRREALEQSFNGNFRYNMPMQENASGFVAVPEQDDIIGSLLLGTHTTNKSILLADKLYEVGNIDRIIQGTSGDETEDSYWYKLFKAMPGIDIFNTSKSNIKWRGYQTLQASDPVLKALYSREDGVFEKYMEGVKSLNNREHYTKEVNEFWDDLTQFNYANWTKSDFTNNEKEQFFGKNSMDEIQKEKLFTTLLENKLGKEVVDTIWVKGRDIGDAGFQKIVMEAEAKVPGSGRVIVSFLANKEFSAWAEENSTIKNKNGYVDWKNVDNDPAAIEMKEKINAQYYPLLYLYDKSAYLKVARNQIKNNYPDVYGKVTDSQKSFINTLSLTDFVMHREALSGTPSAGNIASVLSIGAKYLSDDEDKLQVLNWAADQIDGMDTDLDTKDTLKQGTLIANADMLNRVYKDENFMAEHGDSVKKAVNILYDVTDRIVLEGKNVHSKISADMNDDQKRAYKYNYGSSYVQRPYMKTNSAIGDKLVATANKTGPEGLRSLYTPTSNSSNRAPVYQTASSPATKYSVPRPPVLDNWFRISREGGTASITSADLVKQTVKRGLLGDGSYKTPNATSYTKRIPIQKSSVKPLRTAKITKRGPNVQLPLGLINIG